MERTRLPHALAWALVAFFWVALVALPLGAVFSRAFDASLLDPMVLSVAYATAWQAFWSTALSLGVGLPLGLAIGRSGGARARIALALLALPFGVPTVVAGTAWVSWLGRSGPLQGLGFSYSLKAVVLAHVFYNAPWIALWVAQARANVPGAQLEAARTLGAGAVERFRRVTWPVVRFPLGAAGAQTFSFCAMSFALVLLLGGGPPVQTLETGIYSSVRTGSVDFGLAIAFAAWEIALTLLPWIGVLFFEARSERQNRDLARASEASRRAPPRLPLSLLFFSFIFLAPYLIVLKVSVLSSFLQTGFWQKASPALLFSFALAVATAFGATVLSLAAALSLRRSRMSAFWSVAWGLPSGISVLVLGLGFWIAYQRWVDPFSGSVAAIVLIQTALFWPLIFRALWPVARQEPLRLREAARSLGASPFQVFLAAEWPRWRSPLFSAMALAGGAALGEVAIVSFFYSNNRVPLPLLISRLMGQYRFEDAQAAAALLLLASGALIFFTTYLGNIRDRTGIH